LGRRVQKAGGDASTAIAWYDTKGHLLAETDASGNLTNEYIYFGGRRIARREASGTVLYYFNDRMQTNRAMTDSTGHVQQMSEFYPFGGEKVITGTLDNRFKFAGKRRDSETGLDHSPHRMYEQSIGRWLAVDRGRMHLGNPQSLNRYALVLNNPTNLYDALGDDAGDDDAIYDDLAFGMGDWPYWGSSGDVSEPSGGTDGSTSDLPDAPSAVAAANGTLPSPAPDYSVDFTESLSFNGGGVDNSGSPPSAWDTSVMVPSSALDQLVGAVAQETGALADVSTWAEFYAASAVAGLMMPEAGGVMDYDAYVIGRGSDLAGWADTPFTNVLNLQEWTPELNAEWVDAGISNGNPFIVSSPMDGASFVNAANPGGTSVFFTEFNQVMNAGYGVLDGAADGGYTTLVP
jgi:RHS repeat-associated protein